MSFRDNKHYDHLAVEGLTELHDQDKQTKKEDAAEVKEEIKDVAENLNYTLSTENTIDYNYGLLNVKPVKDKVLKKPDKLSDYYKKSSIASQDVKSKLSAVNFYKDHPRPQNITRQRKKYTQAGHKLYRQYNGGDTEIYIKPRISAGCYVDPKNCYIKFDIFSNEDASFGKGSAANIFRWASITTSSNEHYKYDNIHQYNTIKDHWQKDAEYFLSTEYRAKGYGNSGIVYQSDYIIKLADLVPLFNVDSMLPPELLNDCEIRLGLEDPSYAFVSDPPMVANYYYEVANLKIIYDCHLVDTKYISSIHSGDISLKTFSYISEHHCVTAADEIHLKRDHNKDVKYYITKKTLCRSDYETDNSRDMFEFLTPNGGNSEPSAYKWTTGINEYPEVEESKYENQLHNEHILSPDRRVNDMDDYYIEVLNLSRNRDNSDGILIDDRNFVRYYYNKHPGGMIDVHFFKFYNRDVTIDGVKENYKKPYELTETVVKE